MERASVKIRVDALSLLAPVLILITTLGAMLFVWYFVLSGEVILAVAGLGFLIILILRELLMFPRKIIFNENEIVVKNIFSFSKRSFYTKFVLIDEASCALQFEDMEIPLRYAGNIKDVLSTLSKFIPDKNIDLKRDLVKEFSVRNNVFICIGFILGAILLFLVYLGYDFGGGKYFFTLLSFGLLIAFAFSNHIGAYLLRK